MNKTIREASTKDIKLINKMAFEVFPVTYKNILTKEQSDYMMDLMYSPENIKKQIEKEKHTYFIAYLGDIPTGYISIMPEGEKTFHIQKLYVLPKFQGQKFGELLFKHAIIRIKNLNSKCCLVKLNVNKKNKAINFYKKMGMKKIEEGNFDIGKGFYMNDYIMGIKLTSPKKPLHIF